MERVLLEEVFPEHTADLKNQLLVFRKCVGTDELYDFLEFGFFLEKIHCIVPEAYPVRCDILFKPVSKTLGVQTVTCKPVNIAGIISVVLGSGVTYPYFSSIFQFLFENIFIFKGMRDSQKFVGILVLMYSFLGSMGIDALIKEIKEKSSKSRNTVTGNWKIISATLMLIVLLIPSAYTYTMFNGFHGQLTPTDYPKEWYDVNSYLANDSEDFDILFFPWHQYMTFSWTGRRIANPATIFFDKGTISGENMEVGDIYTHSTDSTQHYIQYILDNRKNISNMGELVTPLNVKYVVLAKEVDFKDYAFLYDQKDMTLVMESEKIALFRNDNIVSRVREIGTLEPVSSWGDIIVLSEEQNINTYGFIPENQEYEESGTNSILQDKLNYTTFSPFIYRTGVSSNYVAFTQPNHGSSGWFVSNSRQLQTAGLRIIFGPETDKYSKVTLLYWPIIVHLAGVLISMLTFIILYSGRMPGESDTVKLEEIDK